MNCTHNCEISTDQPLPLRSRAASLLQTLNVLFIFPQLDVHRMRMKGSWSAIVRFSLFMVMMTCFSGMVLAEEPTHHHSSEATLKLPDLNGVKFLFNTIGGRDLLWAGLLVSFAGIIFGLVVSSQLKRLPVH